jgi:hypothetical protein
LLTSELATTPVPQARPHLALAMELDGPRVRVQVADGGVDPPRARPVPRTNDADGGDAQSVPDAPGGLGLALVTALATRWGFEQRRGDGKVVWFELAAS